MFRTLLLAVFGLSFGSAAPAADSRSEQFRDWRATCFSYGGCEASTGDTLRLIVERTGADRAGWFIAIEFLGKPVRTDRAITLVIAGHPDIILPANGGFRAYRANERMYVTGQGALSQVLPALLAGHQLRIDYFDVAAEARSFRLSLSGLTASLLWIETELKIAGAPRIAILPSDLPDAEPPQTDPVRKAGIPETVLAFHQRTSDCEFYDDSRMLELGAVIEPLSDTANLYALPCTAHAYNVTYRLYLRQTGEIGGIRTLYFADYSTETNWSGTDLLFNVSVDGPRLSAFYKGRGLGDCGTSGEWIWQGYHYKLVRFTSQAECKGVLSDRWPVIFP